MVLIENETCRSNCYIFNVQHFGVLTYICCALVGVIKDLVVSTYYGIQVTVNSIQNYSASRSGSAVCSNKMLQLYSNISEEKCTVLLEMTSPHFVHDFRPRAFMEKKLQITSKMYLDIKYYAILCTVMCACVWGH
jgi:hypothetical protein